MCGMEEVVGKLEPSKSYCLKNATMKEFHGMRNVSLSTRSKVQCVCDVRDVSEEGVSGEGVLVVKAEIVVVSNLKFELYVNCRGCKVEVLKLSEAFGECTKRSKSEY